MIVTLNPHPRTRQQLADILGHSAKTLYRRIKSSDLKVESRTLLTLDEQAHILEIFGRQVRWKSTNP